MTALKEESWHHFRKYYWIRHVIWLLLQASTQKPFGEYSLKRPIHFGDNCTTLAKTLEIILTPQPGLGATSMDCTVTSSFSSPGTSHGEVSNVLKKIRKTIAGTDGYISSNSYQKGTPDYDAKEFPL